MGTSVASDRKGFLLHKQTPAGPRKPLLIRAAKCITRGLGTPGPSHQLPETLDLHPPPGDGVLAAEVTEL